MNSWTLGSGKIDLYQIDFYKRKEKDQNQERENLRMNFIVSESVLSF